MKPFHLHSRLRPFLLTSAVALLLGAAPRPSLGAVQFSDPAPLVPPATRSELELMLDEGMNATALTQDDIKSMLCLDQQDNVIQCRDVMPFDEYAKQNCQRLFGLAEPPVVRKRRHLSSQWNSFWSSPSNTNSFSDFSNFGSFFGNFGGGSAGATIVCPTPIDQSLFYQLNPDSTLYPIDAISAEFAINAFSTCLTNEIVLASDPPQVIVEPFRLASNATCPFTQLRLYSYQSLRFPGICWVLQNFGDLILYRQCAANRFCRGCQSQGSRYGSFGFSGVVSQKLCQPEYRALSFWAFCPSLPQGQRFVRDRIVVPIACSCNDVPCERV